MEQAQAFPSNKTMQHAVRYAMKQDKPIMMDYYQDSFNKKAFFAEEKNTKRKFLIKENQEEYTSDIISMGKSDNDYIFITENSIYICNSNMPKTMFEPSN